MKKNKNLSAEIQKDLVVKRSCKTGNFLGALLGIFAGIYISKLLLIDILPVHFEDFQDLKEVILILYSQIMNNLFVHPEDSFWANIIPEFIRNFFGGLLAKLKMKLFFMFKVNPIPMHIKVLGVVIPLVVMFISMKIGSAIGGRVQKSFQKSI